MNLELKFRDYEFKIKKDGGKQYIFDIIRSKYIMLTPEEWVRQHIIWYLIENVAYPKTLISVEKVLLVNGLRKRYDIVVYDKAHQPWMLIECKEPNVPISETTLQQILSYQRTMQCPYAVLTNGQMTFCGALSAGGITWLEALPPLN